MASHHCSWRVERASGRRAIQSSTSVSRQPTRDGATCRRLGNRPAFSRRHSVVRPKPVSSSTSDRFRIRSDILSRASSSHVVPLSPCGDHSDPLRFGEHVHYPVNIRMPGPDRFTRPPLGAHDGSAVIPERIWVESSELRWDYGAPRQPGPQRRALRDFIDLSNPKAPEDDLAKRVLLFAGRYGVLELCRHGDLARHLGNKERYCPPTGREPLERWLHLSRLVRAVWSAAETLKQGKVAHPDEGYAPWVVLGLIRDDMPPGPQMAQLIRRNLPSGPQVGRPIMATLKGIVAVKLTTWFREAGVSTELEWPAREATPRLRHGGAGAFPTVLWQLSAAIASTDRFVLCAGCGDSFAPSRKPKAGQKSWCEDCRSEGKDRKAARRAYRTRERGRAKKKTTSKEADRG